MSVSLAVAVPMVGPTPTPSVFISKFVSILVWFVLTLSMLCSSLALAQADKVQKVNVNAATVSELAERLPGIGPAKAQSIVSYREENGAFTRIEDLINVKGIGPAILAKITPLVVLGDTLSQNNLFGVQQMVGSLQSRRIERRVVTSIAHQDETLRPSVQLNSLLSPNSQVKTKPPQALNEQAQARVAVQAVINQAKRDSALVESCSGDSRCQ